MINKTLEAFEKLLLAEETAWKEQTPEGWAKFNTHVTNFLGIHKQDLVKSLLTSDAVDNGVICQGSMMYNPHDYKVEEIHNY